MMQQHTQHASHGEVTQEAFSPEEQQAWVISQQKLQQAAKIGHSSNLKFAQADEHLSRAEAASREADAAAAREAEHNRELQQHRQGLEGLKSKLTGLHDTHTATGRSVEEQLAAQQRAQQEVGLAERAAAEKKNALLGLKGDLDGHHARYQSLEEKLAQHRRLTKEREAEHLARKGEHDHLRRSHDANLAEVERLTREHEPLGRELEEHEARLQHLRKRHDAGLRAIYAAKDKANQSHQRLHSYDPSLHQHALEALHTHKQREQELAEELAAAKHRAHEHQHAYDQTLAAHKKALAHLESLRGRAPNDRDVLEAQRAHEAARAKLAEHEAQAKRSHALYRRHQQGAEEHGGRAAELQALADRHAQAYQSMRREGDDAVAEKERLWAEAKSHGDTGVGHFKEKVTKLDDRLDHLGDKVKGLLTGNKDGQVATHQGGVHAGQQGTHGAGVTHGTGSGVTGTTNGGHATSGHQVHAGGLSGTAHSQGGPQGGAQGSSLAAREAGTADGRHTGAVSSDGGPLGAGLSGGHAAGGNVLGGHQAAGSTTPAHDTTHLGGTTGTSHTTSTTGGTEGGIKGAIKGLFGKN